MSEAKTFRLLEGSYVVARLEPETTLDAATMQGEFWSVTRTRDELSVVTNAAYAPPSARIEPGWRALQLLGPIPFETTGVAAAFTQALASRDISVFVISTFDTDYLLVKEADRARAITALREAGYETLNAER